MSSNILMHFYIHDYKINMFPSQIQSIRLDTYSPEKVKFSQYTAWRHVFRHSDIYFLARMNM